MPTIRCPEGCGACCDPVVSPFTLDMLRRIPPWELDEDGRADRAFMLEHLTPLPRREGIARARYLTQGGVTFGMIAGELVEVWSQFYSCDRFDPETRRCTAYDERPPMCRDYPWYGDPPDPRKALPTTCTHLTELGRQPVPVEITPRSS